jgi:hypothetical protein
MNRVMTRRALMKGGLLAGALVPVAGLLISGTGHADLPALGVTNAIAKCVDEIFGAGVFMKKQMAGTSTFKFLGSRCYRNLESGYRNLGSSGARDVHCIYAGKSRKRPTPGRRPAARRQTFKYHGMGSRAALIAHQSAIGPTAVVRQVRIAGTNRPFGTITLPE